MCSSPKIKEDMRHTKSQGTIRNMVTDYEQSITVPVLLSDKNATSPIVSELFKEELSYLSQLQTRKSEGIIKQQNLVA